MSKIAKEPWEIGERTKNDFSDFTTVYTSGKSKDLQYDFIPKRKKSILLVEKNVAHLTEHEFHDCLYLSAAAPAMYQFLQKLYLSETDADKATKIRAVLRAARGRKMKGYDDFFEVQKSQMWIDFCDFKFLANAISKDKSRYSMTFVFCEKEDDHLVMVASDGRRLHLLRPKNADYFGIKEGTYKVLVNTASEIIFAHVDESLKKGDCGFVEHGEFPHYKKVMPTGEIRDTIKGISFCKIDLRCIVSFSRKLKERESINPDYLYELGSYDWSVKFFEGELKAIEFTSGNKQAVIMPMTDL